MADNEDRSRELLAAHMEKTAGVLTDFLKARGVSIPVLGKAMESFSTQVVELPGEAACTPGCAWCCHLRVTVSIPELLVIFEELRAQTTPEGMTCFKQRVQAAVRAGNTLDDAFWYESRTPCPFLDNKNGCLIYPIRPFSCRAHHSTDAAVCRQGYEERRQVMLPCFPLYRAGTDMYSAVFIRVMADLGFASSHLGFVKGLALLFEDPGLAEAWLNRADVFSGARIEPERTGPGQ